MHAILQVLNLESIAKVCKLCIELGLKSKKHNDAMLWDFLSKQFQLVYLGVRFMLQIMLPSHII